MPKLITTCVVALAALAALTASPTARSAAEQTSKTPKLSTPLAELDAAAKRGENAEEVARRKHLKVRGGRVVVVVEAAAGTADDAARSVESVGGTVDARHGRLVQARVGPGQLAKLAADEAVRLVRPPAYARAEAVAGEQVAASGAGTWHASGHKGGGAKVAVIDLGFGGLAERQAAGDLPASTEKLAEFAGFCSPDLDTGEEERHGTAVAEIVHEMAPDAELALICVDSEVTLAEAVDWAETNGVDVINHSVGWYNTSRGDTSAPEGSPVASVADARDGGILWVNAAGNGADEHWSGAFADADNDNRHEFAPGDETNSVTVGRDQTFCAHLKWDDWPASSNDYDLSVRRADTNQIVAVSLNEQSGTQAPVESACFANFYNTTSFYVRIVEFDAAAAPRFDLFAYADLERRVTPGSVTEPATSPHAFAAGAVCWQSGNIEPYSSRGPTIDGRTKPDIAAHDSVSSGTYGMFTSCPSAFAGTSAASPTVAGAAALLAGQNPSLTPAQLEAELRSATVDAGTPGLDNVYGSGRLLLGTPPPATAARRFVADFTGDGKDDIAVWRPSTGTWWVHGQAPVSWGVASDVPVPGDYDADPADDIAIWRPSTGTWWIHGAAPVTWGTAGDVPVPADYDGDGKTDIAVWRPSTGTWWIRDQTEVHWGAPTDIPVVGDYDADPADDIAIWRPSTGAWWIQGSAAAAWGTAGDVPVPADYSGDGKTELAVWRPSTGTWLVQGEAPVAWGVSTDVPVPGDFDADAADDMTVWRPSSGTWWIHGSPPVNWGISTDVP